jgi:peptidoglycan/LPS O-acetylase OafA/YrhL
MKQGRLPELDAIRGCAIVMVLIWHYVACGKHTAGEVSGHLVTGLGLLWSGVDLFFVLSGFLITGILLDNRSVNNYFTVFYLRRIGRIFPLYYLLLGSFVLLWFVRSYRNLWLLQDPFPLWSYASFTQNILMGLYGRFGPPWLGVTWSLAVEEQFYCVVPLLVWLLPRRTFAAVALLLVILAPLLRSTWGGFHSFVWAPWRGDSLMTGALLAVAVREARILRWFQANILALYAALAIFLVGLAFFDHHPLRANYTWLAGLYGVLLLLAVVDRQTLVARVLRNRVLIWFGTTSYAIYVFHQPVSGLVHGYLGDGAQPSVDSAESCGLTLLALAITLVMAEASSRYFERPFLEWAHRMQYGGTDARTVLSSALLNLSRFAHLRLASFRAPHAKRQSRTWKTSATWGIFVVLVFAAAVEFRARSAAAKAFRTCNAALEAIEAKNTSDVGRVRFDDLKGSLPPDPVFKKRMHSFVMSGVYTWTWQGIRRYQIDLYVSPKDGTVWDVTSEPDL